MERVSAALPDGYRAIPIGGGRRYVPEILLTACPRRWGKEAVWSTSASPCRVLYWRLNNDVEAVARAAVDASIVDGSGSG